ncbi:MAG: aldo/keto reductase [Bacillota bacterium]|nr:aldo/keto reductase [Bacillota bacterium]
MDKVLLSKTDMYVSKAALGTDTYGLTLDKAKSYEMLDFFMDQGGNLIDTALVYSNWAPGEKSRSEKMIGAWMNERKNRDKVIISTKGAHPEIEHMDITRLSREEITSDINESLEHLKTDYIDIYWLHRDCEALPVGEIMETLNDLVKAGKTRYIGMSNWTHKRIEEANRYASGHGLAKIISSQIQYSLAQALTENNDPTLVLMNDDEYSYFSDHNLSVFAFASQAKGFFSKLYNGGIDNLSPKAKERYLSETNLKRFERIKEYALSHGITVGQLVVGGLCENKDFQTIPIVGCKNIPQLEESLSGADIKLTKEDIDFLLNK